MQYTTKLSVHTNAVLSESLCNGAAPLLYPRQRQPGWAYVQLSQVPLLYKVVSVVGPV